MNFRFFSAVYIITLAILTPRPPIFAQSKADRLESLPIHITPKPPEWREFMKRDASFRQNLWNYHFKRGKKLKDWAWEWRVGWIKTCVVDSRTYCDQLVRDGLQDDAAVVRAETASLLGKRFQSTKDQNVVKILGVALSRADNLRHGKPLFVVNHILKALFEIGGDQALNMGKNFAAKHPSTHQYWRKVQQL